MNTSSIDKITTETYLNNLLNQFKANSPLIDSDFITTLQKNALSQVKELTLPTQREEEWRFTDLSPLYKHQFQTAESFTINPEYLPRFSVSEAINSRIVFVNGFYSPELSDTSALPDGVFVGNLAQLSLTQKEKFVKYLGQQKGNLDVFVALNTVSLRDVAIIWANSNVVIDTPIHLLWLTVPSDTPSLVQPRTLIIGETSSKLTILEEYKAVAENCVDVPTDKPYFNNIFTEVYLQDNAQLNHTRFQRESADGVHIGKTSVSQGRDSIYTENELSLGSQLHRHTVEIWQAGEQISTQLNGLTAIKDKLL
jgi:Fe-S cluster assembly protein SufD